MATTVICENDIVAIPLIRRRTPMKKSLLDRLTGTVTSVFTPFNEDLEIDFEALEKHLVLQCSGGARSFYVMAYNSRYGQLTDREVLDLNSFCARTVKRLNPDAIVIVGDPINGSTMTSTEFAMEAKESGADMISLIFQDKFFSDDQVLDHLAEIGRASDFPIMVHEMQLISGFDGKQRHWPESLLFSLPKIPQVQAIKEDSKDEEITKLALSLEPDIRVVISGSKKRLLNFRDHGARAYLNGISIFDAEIGEMFWETFQSGDIQEAQKIIDNLESPFFEGPVAKFGWHRTNKALLQAAGIMHRRDRMPLNHISDIEFLEVEKTYQKIQEAWQTIRNSG